MLKPDWLERSELAWGLLFLVSLTLAYAASAAIVVSETPGLWELRDAASHVLGPKFPSYPECKAEAAKAVGEYKCINVTGVSVVGNCDGVAMPVRPVVVDSEGFTLQPGLVIPDDWGPTMQEGFVSAAYPACWTAGLVLYTGEVSAPEGPLDTSPGPWIEGVDYDLGAPCPAAAHGVCYPSPNKPKPVP